MKVHNETPCAEFDNHASHFDNFSISDLYFNLIVPLCPKIYIFLSITETIHTLTLNRT